MDEDRDSAVLVFLSCYYRLFDGYLEREIAKKWINHYFMTLNSTVHLQCSCTESFQRHLVPDGSEGKVGKRIFITH